MVTDADDFFTRYRTPPKPAIRFTNRAYEHKSNLVFQPTFQAWRSLPDPLQHPHFTFLATYPPNVKPCPPQVWQIWGGFAPAMPVLVDVNRSSAASVAAFHTWRTVGGLSCLRNHLSRNAIVGSAATYNLQENGLFTPTLINGEVT